MRYSPAQKTLTINTRHITATRFGSDKVTRLRQGLLQELPKLGFHVLLIVNRCCFNNNNNCHDSRSVRHKAAVCCSCTSAAMTSAAATTGTAVQESKMLQP